MIVLAEAVADDAHRDDRRWTKPETQQPDTGHGGKQKHGGMQGQRRLTKPKDARAPRRWNPHRARDGSVCM
jgi:hypothetical protein